MKTILIPTDFSANSTNAMRYGLRLAKTINSKVVFFHLITPAGAQGVSIPAERELRIVRAREERKQKEKLNQLVEEVFKRLMFHPDSVKTKVIVKSGILIVEEILEVARRNNASLIITGTHGASGMEKLFGSNTSLLIAKGHLPVLAIPPGYKYKEIRRMVYASDLKQSAEELKWIVPVATAFSASIDVFNLSNDEKLNETGLFNTLFKEADYPALSLVRLKRNPNETVVKQLREFIAFSKPDLLVMFHEKKGFFESFFRGNKTEKMSYNLIVPLLSIGKYERAIAGKFRKLFYRENLVSL